MRERGVAESAIPISERVGMPLIEAASMESGEDLQDIWAQLIANARDPHCDSSLQRGFIEAISQFEPFDAEVLEILGSTESWVQNKTIGRALERRNDEVAVSLANLSKLECVSSENLRSRTTALGRKLLIAYQS